MPGVVWLLLVGFVTGCSSHPDLMTQADGCDVRRDTVMTVRQERGVLLLPGTFNDAPVQLKLDTAADVSTISPAVVARFGLEEDRGRERLLRGVGGDIRTGSVIVRRFSIGMLPPRPAVFSLGVGNLLPGLSPPVAGLLGTDLLGGHDLDLDTPHLLASLYTVATCPDFQPWADGRGVAVTHTASGLSLVVIDIGGNAVRALIDTGARTTFMTRRLAEALGVSDAQLAADPLSVRRGVSLSEVDVRLHRFDRLVLGPVVWRDVEVEIADVTVPGVDMLLGVDLLGKQRVWLSPRRGMLWLR